MNDELTKIDIEKMKQELAAHYEEMPAILEEVKRTRAFGDLSENFEYKAAKQAQNHCRKRIRYLEGMIKTAKVYEDTSAQDEVGLFDKVVIYIPEDNDCETIQVVTTVRTDPRRGLVSKESPFGKTILGKKVGDEITVVVNDNYSYKAIIKSIEKCEDDGSAPLLEY